MNISVRTLSVIAWISVIFKFMMIPGGGVLLVLSLSLLSMFYIIFGFALFNKLGFKQMFNPDLYDDIPRSRIYAAIGLGIAYAIVCMGMLFRLQQWPGGNDHLRTGLVLLTGFLLYNIFKSFKTKSDYHRWISLRILMFGLLAVLVFNISNLKLVKIQYRNHPSYIEAYQLYDKNPSDEILIENLDIEQHRATMNAEDFELYLKWREKDKEREKSRN